MQRRAKVFSFVKKASTPNLKLDSKKKQEFEDLLPAVLPPKKIIGDDKQ
jgi:hypothetical protein